MVITRLSFVTIMTIMTMLTMLIDSDHSDQFSRRPTLYDDHDRYNTDDEHDNNNIHDKDEFVRFGGEGPEVAVLDASDLMCPGRYLYNVLMTS